MTGDVVGEIFPKVESAVLFLHADTLLPAAIVPENDVALDALLNDADKLPAGEYVCLAIANWSVARIDRSAE